MLKWTFTWAVVGLLAVECLLMSQLDLYARDAQCDARGVTLIPFGPSPRDIVMDTSL